MSEGESVPQGQTLNKMRENLNRYLTSGNGEKTAPIARLTKGMPGRRHLGKEKPQSLRQQQDLATEKDKETRRL